MVIFLPNAYRIDLGKQNETIHELDKIRRLALEMPPGYVAAEDGSRALVDVGQIHTHSDHVRAHLTFRWLSSRPAS